MVDEMAEGTWAEAKEVVMAAATEECAAVETEAVTEGAEAKEVVMAAAKGAVAEVGRGEV